MIVFTKCTVACAVSTKKGFSVVERPFALWGRYQEQVEATPEWLADNQKKQHAYEKQREAWNKLVGIIKDE